MSRRIKPNCTAVIGDFVRSRTLPELSRYVLQERFERLVEHLNASYGDAAISEFAIGRGDEFQVLLERPQVIPDLIWHFELALPELPVRIGIGHGNLSTPVRRDPYRMDGPVFHLARAAVDNAGERLGGVFSGFGATEDQVLNGLARILRRIRNGWTAPQREIVEALRRGDARADIAARLSISKQAVSKRARAAGWDAFREGEIAWRSYLELFDRADEWASLKDDA